MELQPIHAFPWIYVHKISYGHFPRPVRACRTELKGVPTDSSGLMLVYSLTGLIPFRGHVQGTRD